MSRQLSDNRTVFWDGVPSFRVADHSSRIVGFAIAGCFWPEIASRVYDSAVFLDGD